MLENNPTKKFYEDRYKNGYMENYWTDRKIQRISEIIKNLILPTEGKALDFGCGDGTITEVLRQSLPSGWIVCGVDISSAAIEKARRRYPLCRFYQIGTEEISLKEFDFLFTHHVLEHVDNLTSVVEEIDNFLKPSCTMVNILPCGNQGSFEWKVCKLRKDGIDITRGNRFFFEEPGHVRRLITQNMESLFSEKGFELSNGYYSNQYYGAIDWITKAGPSFVIKFTDPAFAVDEECKRKLKMLRMKLLPTSVLYFLTSSVENRLKAKNKTTRNLLFLFGLFSIYVLMKPIQYVVESILQKREYKEWAERKKEPNGSEMYLVFVR
jgi:SAM-dependent methyltransferase